VANVIATLVVQLRVAMFAAAADVEALQHTFLIPKPC